MNYGGEAVQYYSALRNKATTTSLHFEGGNHYVMGKSA